MLHQNPYIREVPGSRCALLCLHGIVGTPRHFDDLIAVLPHHWSVYNLLLKGHGKTVRDFSAATMQDWRKQAQEAVRDLLNRYDCVAIAAHSMGTLLALECARLFPGIKGLFLMAVPLKPFVRPKAAINGLRIALGLVNPKNQACLDMRRACSIQPSRRLWLYLGWTPNFWNLLRQIRFTRTFIGSIHIPCVVFQSKKDELVANSAAKLLPPAFHTTVLPYSGHFQYAPGDLKQLLDAFQAFCDAMETA